MSRFILPPHPGSKNKCKREDLHLYENQEWVAQRKFNGTHVVIWIDKNEVCIWDRRGNELSLYKLTNEMKHCLINLNFQNKETVLVGELLHTKAKRKDTNQQALKDTIVLFDVLFYGNYLTTITQDKRLDLLEQICREPKELEEGAFFGATKRALIVEEFRGTNLWMAERFFDEFSYHFDECVDDDNGYDKYPEIEGLILRQRMSKLQVNPRNDVDWIVKCRKPKEKIYDF